MNANRTPSHMYDALVIGAGHNGLVCANYLARAGRKVLVLERGSEIGGGAITREIAPDFRVSACAHVLDMFEPDIFRDLKLKKHGLVYSRQALPIVALAEDGRHLYLGDDQNRAESSIAPHGFLDAKAYIEFSRTLARISEAIRPLAENGVVRLVGEPLSRGVYARIDRGLARLDKDERRLVQELVPGPLASILERYFETPLLQAAVAFSSTLGLSIGPRSPGSGLAFLRRIALERRGKRSLAVHPVGGVGALSEALGAAALARGVEIRTGVNVAQILVEDGQVAGIQLDDGELITARSVVSSIEPSQTFLGLLPAGVLDAGFRRRVTNVRSTAMTAKVHLALDGLPEFKGLNIPDMASRLVIAPSLNVIEEGYSAALEGRFSADPVMEVVLPSIHDPSLAPIGQHVMSVVVQYAPYEIVGGWDKGRDGLAERVLTTLGRYAPGIEEKVIAGEILVPPDIESVFGVPGGHWHHIDLAPDQLYWLRPVPGAEDHRTPLCGLYLCGAATHPGGGVSGLPGRNAARALIAQERRS